MKSFNEFQEELIKEAAIPESDSVLCPTNLHKQLEKMKNEGMLFYIEPDQANPDTLCIRGSYVKEVDGKWFIGTEDDLDNFRMKLHGFTTKEELNSYYKALPDSQGGPCISD